jgi:hypothetical protein
MYVYLHRGSTFVVVIYEELLATPSLEILAIITFGLYALNQQMNLIKEHLYWILLICIINVEGEERRSHHL